MVSAVESTGCIYWLWNEEGRRIRVSECARVERGKAVVFSCVGLHGSERSAYFGVLLQDCTGRKTKELVVYEARGGKGSAETVVVRVVPVAESAHRVVRVPGVVGGTLVVAEDAAVVEGLGARAVEIRFPGRSGMVVSDTVWEKRKGEP
jgi:hypothetical protein